MRPNHEWGHPTPPSCTKGRNAQITNINECVPGTTIQLLAFIAAEFPVQLLVKRYGFRRILPTLMFCWSTVSWAQAFMTNRTGYYLARAFIGLCEGGFIPGTILFATYFYTSKELSVRLATFWTSLSMLSLPLPPLLEFDTHKRVFSS